MACRDFEQRVALYVEDDLDPVERYGTERHLRLCADCAALAEDLRESQAVFKSLRQTVPDEAMLLSVRREVFDDMRAMPRTWADILFGAFRPRATLAGVLLLFIGSFVWFHDGRDEVRPTPVAPSRMPAPVIVPNELSAEPAPRVAAAKPKARLPKRLPPDLPDESKPQITIKLLTDDPNIIIYWLVDENGD